MKNETTGFVQQNRAQAARQRRNPLRHRGREYEKKTMQPSQASVRSKPNNTVAESVTWPHEGEGQRTPGDPFTSDSIIYRWLPLLTCPSLPLATERACTHYTGVEHEEGYQNAASTDTTYVIHDSPGHAVSYLASQLSTYRIDTERRESKRGGTVAARARAHVPPARINHGISTLLRRRHG